MLRHLFLDMNSYFAAVEQQADRALRGRPVAVVPMLAEHTCCIAASYEAKAFGVKTGTHVQDARALCPHIRLVPANVPLYRDYHDRIVAVVESCLPEPRVLSVDEMVCRLWDNDRHPADAMALGERIKGAIKRELGIHLSCSVGIAPNAFLAKVAAELQKPNGLVVVNDEDLPRKLFGMRLTDWPGISARMERRFAQAGVSTTEDMYALTLEEMRAVWGGVGGERWWRMIRGEQVQMPPVRRGQVGHSYVLPPELRTPAGAARVSCRLLEKAAERMRFLGYHARRMAVQVRSFREEGWTRKAKFAPARDTWTLMHILSGLWAGGVRCPSQVAVCLYDVIADMDVSGSLFTRDDLWRATEAVDALNRRFGRGTVGMASVLPVKGFAPDRIAFGKVHEMQ